MAISRVVIIVNTNICFTFHIYFIFYLFITTFQKQMYFLHGSFSERKNLKIITIFESILRIERKRFPSARILGLWPFPIIELDWRNTKLYYKLSVCINGVTRFV